MRALQEAACIVDPDCGEHGTRDACQCICDDGTFLHHHSEFVGRSLPSVVQNLGTFRSCTQTLGVQVCDSLGSNILTKHVCRLGDGITAKFV